MVDGSEAAAPASVPSAMNSQPRPQGVVLIADDEGPVRRMCEIFVRRLGYTAVGVEDGDEAVAYYKAHAGEVVCVMLDLSMPRMDGAMALLELQAIRPDVKAILCSGYTEHEVAQKFAIKGLAGFLQKPYSLGEFEAKIKAVIGSG